MYDCGNDVTESERQTEKGKEGGEGVVSRVRPVRPVIL